MKQDVRSGNVASIVPGHVVADNRGVSATPPQAAPPAHYENFPVASWLCPPHLRPPIAAIYHFARTADDIADEGDASPDQRLAELNAYRADAGRCRAGAAALVALAPRVRPAGPRIAQYGLPEALLADLLSAFMQDIEKTRDAPLCRPRRAAGLLPPLGQPGRPPAAASLWRDDAAGAGAAATPSAAPAAHQLLAGPERRPAARPLLLAADRLRPRMA
jgi:hypothetical protein